MRLTRIGGPTLLVEIGGWRMIVDPTFDPPGRRYAFGWGTSSIKMAGPALPLEALGSVDLAFVSHDHHADNLDDAGRRLLATVATVVTTRAGARRLTHPDVKGLRAGQTVRLEAAGLPPLVATATPARHGPPLSLPIAGPVIGLALSREGQARTELWITGDTVLTRRLLRTGRALDVDVMVVNGGGVAFGVTGPVRFTMTGADAAKLVASTGPRVAVPAHYDGWSHFVDGEAGMRAALTLDPASATVIQWLPDGEAVDFAAPRPHRRRRKPSATSMPTGSSSPPAAPGVTPRPPDSSHAVRD
ncbi:MBL fold metallo-hydrolase [Demequina sp. NBRC 110055]|uniref:MBL fold metallo-hydrolase n=1 Tax=Demequina sp. NBRC 110055 TaxID=1570344 RepID=UPI0009FDCD11|nr:MBL fold metallo-hydrolase [Demequina sp. NBRC 110055]